MAGPEYTDVEKPLIDQLVGLGWTHLAGSVEDPCVTDRESFAQVVMEPVLRERVRAINLRGGELWLDEKRLDQEVYAITRTSASKVMEANRQATELLLGGLTVEGLPDCDGGLGQTIRLVDWHEPANNHFLLVNQFKVKCPPGFDVGKGHIIPDLVLFVNGIPLVAVDARAARCRRASARRWTSCGGITTSASRISRSRSTRARRRCSRPVSCWSPAISTRRARAPLGRRLRTI